jgi:hypothetical protein
MFHFASTTEARTLNAFSKQEAFCPKSVTRENHLVTSHHFRPQIRRVSQPILISTSTSPPNNHPLHNHLLPPHNSHEDHNHAMTSAPQNLTIYPDYCHALSPTIGKWVPLRATDIHGLQKVGMFCDRELPIALPPTFSSFWFRFWGLIGVDANCTSGEQKNHYSTTKTIR